MSPTNDWLPELLSINDFGGEWGRYVEEIYAVFHRDFVNTQPQFQGQWVRCRRDPIYDGKEAGFWHCMSEGDTEDERIPNLHRCARIAWVRAIIEHAGEPDIEYWSLEKKGEPRHYLWFQESYLVVLAQRRRFFQLITAFCTDQKRYKETLREERDGCKNG